MRKIEVPNSSVIATFAPLLSYYVILLPTAPVPASPINIKRVFFDSPFTNLCSLAAARSFFFLLEW